MLSQTPKIRCAVIGCSEKNEHRLLMYHRRMWLCRAHSRMYRNKQLAAAHLADNLLNRRDVVDVIVDAVERDLHPEPSVSDVLAEIASQDFRRLSVEKSNVQ